MRWWWGPLCSRPTDLVFFIVLAHWNNSPRIDMSLHSDILFWFRANQSLLLLLNATCLAEKQLIPILYSLGLTRPRLEPTVYCSRGEHDNHYTTDAVALYLRTECLRTWLTEAYKNKVTVTVWPQDNDLPIFFPSSRFQRLCMP